MNSNEKEEPIFYKVNHRYRDTIIVPIVAIDKFVSFITTPLRYQRIVTSDGIKCDVIKSFTENICNLEEKVLSLYHLNAWDFIKTWHKVYPENLYSLEFVVMELAKDECK